MRFHEQLPRIALRLLQAQGNAALRFIHIQDDHIHLFRGRDDLAGMRVLLGPGHFGHMDQAFNTGFKLHEGAVIGDVGDTAREFRADRIFQRHAIPRIGHQLLHAKADALRILIEADHLHLDGHTNGERFGRMVDAPPGDVGHMQQAIHAAEVHEGAIIGDVLHDTIQDHAFLEALDEFAALFRTGFFQNGAAGDNDIAARAIHFQDLERLGLTH
jgi:hypothetical protein